MKKWLIQIINWFNNNLFLQICFNVLFLFAFGYFILFSIMEKSVIDIILNVIFFIINLIFLNSNLRRVLRK